MSLPSAALVYAGDCGLPNGSPVENGGSDSLWSVGDYEVLRTETRETYVTRHDMPLLSAMKKRIRPFVNETLAAPGFISQESGSDFSISRSEQHMSGMQMQADQSNPYPAPCALDTPDHIIIDETEEGNSELAQDRTEQMYQVIVDTASDGYIQCALLMYRQLPACTDVILISRFINVANVSLLHGQSTLHP